MSPFKVFCIDLLDVTDGDLLSTILVQTQKPLFRKVYYIKNRYVYIIGNYILN